MLSASGRSHGTALFFTQLQLNSLVAVHGE